MNIKFLQATLFKKDKWRQDIMGKGSELLHLLRTGNSGEARKIIGKIKKQGTCMCIYIYIYNYI